MGLTGKAYEDSLLTDYSIPPPNFVLKTILAVVTSLRSLLLKLSPPASTAVAQCSAFIPSAWLMMTARLGIPDILKDGPLTAAEIASKAGGLREDDIYRALRMLSINGFYEAIPGKDGEPTRFRNSAASSTLRADHPNSIKYLATHWHSDMYGAFDQRAMEWHLNQKGGDEVVPSAFEKVHGKTYWEYAKENPEIGTTFSKAMTNLDNLGLEPQLVDYDFGKFKRVVDIAGANGSVLAAVLQRKPQLKGVLFDQPHVIEGAKKTWEERPEWKAVSDRVSMVGGDFFKSETLPKLQDGDLVFMRAILHDWSDEASIRILNALRTAVGSAKVTLALSEMTLHPEFSFSPLYTVRYSADLLMHAVLRGKERTVEQWSALFEASGFKFLKVQDMRVPYSITEAVPV